MNIKSERVKGEFKPFTRSLIISGDCQPIRAYGWSYPWHLAVEKDQPICYASDKEKSDRYPNSI
jgi:hypothetical protein